MNAMSIINLSFFSSIEETGQANVMTLFYLLKGKVNISTQNESFIMEKQDIIVLNKSQRYKIFGDHVIMARIEINEREYLKLTSSQMHNIRCNTMKHKNDNFDKVRKLLDSLINASFEENYEKLFFEKYAYDLLALLSTDFTEYVIRFTGEEHRKDQIENYIKMNYQNNISLVDVSEYFGLTPQYFSKHFKETFKISFLKYLNEVKIENAHEDLLHTNHTIIKIALDNGFPNVTSFTKAFVQKYKEKPSDYRIKKSDTSYRKEKFALKEDVQQYLHNKDIEISDQVHNVYIENLEVHPLNSYWKNICNLGSLSKLSNGDLRSQVEILKRELGFEYARLTLDKVSFDSDVFNFYEEEKVFDFLLELQFKQIIVIDFRTYHQIDGFIKYFHKLISHCINRYGIDNVKRWEYELFFDTVFTKEKALSYRQFANELNTLFTKLKLHKHVYGPGFLMDENGENLKEFLKYNKEIETISISIAPYSLTNRDADIFLNRITDAHYISHQYQLAKSICDENHIQKLVISAWKNMLVENHYINDSSYRAANIMKNILHGYYDLPTLPIDYPLDLMLDYHKENNMLSGLPGLLTRQGVKKPSFYAYKFLNKLDRNFVYKDEYCLVTNDTNNYFEIVCHNCKELNYTFYCNENNGFDIHLLSQYFEDTEELTFSFKIPDVENGAYFIKSRYMNDEDGSALNKWIQMNFEDSSFFGPDEMQYLKSVSQPSMNGKKVTAINGILEFTFTLQPNEIRHIHIIHLS